MVREDGAHGFLPITTRVRDHLARELGNSVPDVGSVLYAGGQTPAHPLNKCLKVGVSAQGRNSTTTATYHHVVHKSTNSVRFDCRLGEENLSVDLDILLKPKTSAGVCWRRDG